VKRLGSLLLSLHLATVLRLEGKGITTGQEVSLKVLDGSIFAIHTMFAGDWKQHSMTGVGCLQAEEEKKENQLKYVCKCSFLEVTF
jgi:hypothetical protein